MSMDDLRKHIQSHRKDFSADSLDGQALLEDPLKQFEAWLTEAVDQGVNEAYAVTLASQGKDGYPNARVVYLRGIDEGALVFYTNYHSLKGQELRADERAVMNFFWPELHQQVRVKGDVFKVDEQISDDYFASRPRASQIGAWASQQSTVLDSRAELEERIAQLEKDYEGREVPRPPHWGGYRLIPVEWEFWKGRTSRLHDRFRYRSEEDSWVIERLNP